MLIYIAADAADPYKCGALLNDGQWLDPPESNSPHKPYLRWQPPGCTFYEYRTSDIADCVSNGKILFVGDTSVRQVFYSVARKFEGDTKFVAKEQAKRDVPRDLELSRKGISVKFLWDPWLNSTELYDELRAYHARQDSGYQETDSEDGTNKTVAILIGGGLYYARRLEVSTGEQFKNAIDNITATAYPDDSLPNLTTRPQYGKEGVGDQIFFAPVLEPLYDKLSPSRQLTIVPEKIEEMNRHLQERSSQGLNVLWSYANMMKNQPEAYAESGVHVVEHVSTRLADMLLNLRCNSKAAQQGSKPFTRTCCNAYRPTNWVQVTFVLLSLLVLPFAAIKAARRRPESPVNVRFDKSISRQRSLSVSANATASVPLALMIVLVIVSYCYLADRTHTFDKFQKQFNKLDFRILLGFVCIGCLCNIQGLPSSPSRRRSDSFPGSIVRQTFLPRSQTDEFKGWMQVYILLYGYFGAADTLLYYETFRLFLAIYLFLSAYGHTMYFLQKRDYSLQRVGTVLVRLNILPVLLSFMMDRPYAVYVFPPLISFWFLVVYTTLRVASHKNDSLKFLAGKVALSALLVTAFIHLKGGLELISLAGRIVGRAELDVQEWRFYLGIDKFMPALGMLVAISNLWISSVINTPQTRPGLFAEALTDSFEVFRVFFIFASLILGPLFWFVSQSHTKQSDYNWWMPFLGWMPVLSIVYLRNSTRILRSYHSAAFAWIGRMSLELYLLSQHIWLAGDGGLLLRAGFRAGDKTFWGDRWRDLVILTPIFVWCAWRVSAANATLTAWVMKPGPEETTDERSGGREHVRAGSELAFPNYENGLPSPNLHGSNSREAEKQSMFTTTGGVKTRLVVLGLVIWVAKWLS